MNQGRVVAPNVPGIGIAVDWDRLAEADYYVYAHPFPANSDE